MMKTKSSYKTLYIDREEEFKKIIDQLENILKETMEVGTYISLQEDTERKVKEAVDKMDQKYQDSQAKP